jgi:hypothetical protein
MGFGAFFSSSRFRISSSELLARVAPLFPDNPGVETAKTVSKVRQHQPNGEKTKVPRGSAQAEKKEET